MNRQLVTLSVLLATTCALLAEEGFYLDRHPFSPVVGHGIASRFSSCRPLSQTGDYEVAQCKLEGYNTGLFLCKRRFCVGKEPANGPTMTAAERKWLDHLADIFVAKSTPQDIADSQLSQGGR